MGLKNCVDVIINSQGKGFEKPNRSNLSYITLQLMIHAQQKVILARSLKMHLSQNAFFGVNIVRGSLQRTSDRLRL